MTRMRPFTHLLTAILMETPGGAPPMGAPPGPTPTPRPMAPAPASSGKAITSLVVGIAGLCIVWIPFVNVLSFASGIVAIIFGVLAKKEIDASHGQIGGGGMAIAGIVLGALQLILVLLMLLVLGAVWAEFVRELEGMLALFVH